MHWTKKSNIHYLDVVGCNYEQDAGSKLPKDRPVTRQDAEGVVGAELRNNPNISTYPGGVAASVLAAARLNQCYTQTIG